MGLLQAIGTGVGAYFGGPAGATFGGSVGGALDESLTQDQANRYNSAAATESFNRSIHARRTAYQDTMYDMEAAGLNPMLAYSQGPTNLASAAQASYPTGAGAAGVNAVASATQAASSAQVSQASVSKIGQEIVNLKTDNERVTLLLDNVRQEYQNLVKQGYNLTEIGNQIRASIDKLKAEVPLINEQRFQTEMLRRLNELQYSAETKFDNFGREFQQYKPIIDLLKHLFRPYGGHQ